MASENANAFLRSRRTALGVLAVLVLASIARPDDVLVAPGSDWRYLDDGSNQGTAWIGNGFDDSSWASGPAQLGYGDGDEATVVSFGPSASSKYVTTYFRHRFTVSNASRYLLLQLDLVRDDAAIVHLNGVEIVRANLPLAGVTFATEALTAIGGSAESILYPYFVPATLLLAGTNANVLAVEIHQAEPTSSDISFDLRLTGQTTLRTIRGPYLQNGTSDGVSVHWRTNAPVDGRVWYGSAPGSLDQVVDVPSSAYDHEVRITGLAPDTRYYYAVGTTSGTKLAGDDPTYRFRTAPPIGTKKPMRAWIIGDSGTADGGALAVRNAYLAYPGADETDVWLMLGDNAYVIGTDAEYQAAVFGMYEPLLRHTTLWSTRGNHETSAPVYYSLFGMPTVGEGGGVASGSEAYYSFDRGNVHFICLDSQGSDVAQTGAMYNWLRADLLSNGQDWTIAFWHHPPYTKGSHDSDTETRLIQMRSNFLELLEDHAVDLVFCGHSHAYERSFLIDGHYGLSTTFDPASHLKDSGDGAVGSGGPYVKAAAPHAGTVYTVAGSSGKVSGGTLDHPVMVTSLNQLGSVVLDVDGDRIDVRFLRTNGTIGDSFTLISHAIEGLTADVTTMSVTQGGAQKFTLDAGPAHAGETYAVLGSITGTAPGVAFPSGVTLPLTLDFYTSVTFLYANSPVFPGSFSTLDAQGRATAAVNLPSSIIHPSAVGLTIFHAFVTVDAAGVHRFASNAFPLTFLP